MSDESNNEVTAEPKKAKPKFERSSAWSGTVASAIEEAFSEIEEVASEFREVYENAPEGLKESEVNQTRDATASTLENLSTPDVPDMLGELDCSCTLDNGKVYRGRQQQSRQCRANNAAAKLSAAADAIREWAEGKEKIEDISDPNDIEELRERADKLEKLQNEGTDVDDFNSAIDSADELISALEEAQSEIENAEYPGMFG